LLEVLSLQRWENREEIRELSGEIRRAIEGIAIPRDVEAEITGRLSESGENDAYAIRSSATAEDLPTASFAGQQDTYLNVIGKMAILKHISKCWASLFTERSIVYRIQNGFDHRKVQLAVIVQKLVFPEAAGILFTADPVTGNRKVSSIDAGFGLGEALVSGLVNADNYTVRDGVIGTKKISAKKLAIYAASGGGTKEQQIEPASQDSQVLTNDQILELERIGRKVESYFGSPQDIEWCLVNDEFFLVQSRPITTLFPIPKASDQENRVYLSVGHQQMMTDAMKPLGISMWRLSVFHQAGARLFVDVTNNLSTPGGREMLLKVMGGHDPLIKEALQTVIARDFIKLLPEGERDQAPVNRNLAAAADDRAQPELDPGIVSELIARSRSELEQAKQKIETASGPEVFDLILEDIDQCRKSSAESRSLQVVMASVNAANWINQHMEEWLGEKNAADTLAQSVPNNVTSEMGLELLDLADLIRTVPAVVEYLEQADEKNFLDGLPKFDGGAEVRAAFLAYLNKYGMRCPGEIDVTRTRWSEDPTTLVPLILSNVKNFGPGAGQRRFEEGQHAARKKADELLARLRPLPDGERKVEESKQMIARLRNFAGYREYPKYAMVNRYFVYKLALLKEAEQLVEAGVIEERDDVYYLTFEEFREAVRTRQVDHEFIAQRKAEHKRNEKLTPPRVITSEGEIVRGEYRRENLAAGALVGLAVSSGVIEGRARVILNLADARLEEGDILVTTFTDPSWTPLFVAIKGLVTEVGGMNTHGAVIAREYGLPAVVGVENATNLIKDGQRIRVNGTEGYVEFL
jgi:pyruvate,water dikinase